MDSRVKGAVRKVTFDMMAKTRLKSVLHRTDARWSNDGSMIWMRGMQGGSEELSTEELEVIRDEKDMSLAVQMIRGG